MQDLNKYANARNFILAEKYGKVHGLKRVYSVVMAPEDHPTTKNEIKSLHHNSMKKPGKEFLP